MTRLSINDNMSHGYISARHTWRNVHVYNAATQNYLGGVHQAGSITYANLDNMLRSILLVSTIDNFSIRQQSTGDIMTLSNDLVLPGDYEIISGDAINVTDELWLFRTYSYSISGCESAFCDGIRERDRKCMISGRGGLLASSGVWTKLEAAHVFPLESENLWNQFGYSRWITNMKETTDISKINSIQNGLLMKRDLHSAFDQYFFSINPDDGYKIVSFAPDEDGIDGRILEPACRDPTNPSSVSDEILRWHFRQSVLANMRGSGEPVFETDFPPGTDQIKKLSNEPYGKERFEMEMDLRLRYSARDEQASSMIATRIHTK